MLDTTKLPTEYLPASIKELLKSLEVATVYALIEEYGGTRIIVPKIATEEHELARLIGFAELKTFCYLFGGSVFDCPRCLKALNTLRDNEMLADKRAGLTLAELARKHGITERGVSKALRRVEQQEYQARVQFSQLDLFQAA